MVEISEKNFESSIEAALLASGPDDPSFEPGVVAEPAPVYGAYAPGGYHKRNFKDYDRALSLDPGMVQCPHHRPDGALPDRRGRPSSPRRSGGNL